MESLREADCDVEAVFANRVKPGFVDELSTRFSGREPPVYVLPEVGLLQRRRWAIRCKRARAS